MGFMRFHVLALFFVVMCLALGSNNSLADYLEVGFYQKTCPNAEAVVRQFVGDAVARDPELAAAFTRMHFHDCFVRGCDASILLDSIPGGPKSEKESPVNFPSLRGYDVIEAAKEAIEGACPFTVSCADIVAFAARDSAYFSGNISYSVPAGRRDGRISVEADTLRFLPAPVMNAEQLEIKFANKGLTLDEMVTLSGAHSIGRSHCSSFAPQRLYNFSATQITDPSIDRSFVSFLKMQCPQDVTNLPSTVPLDVVTPNKLDNRYYVDLTEGRGVLESDQTLWTSSLTAGLVAANAQDADAWAAKFAAAMVKMGYIEVLTGNQGEIRKKCNVVNNI